MTTGYEKILKAVFLGSTALSLSVASASMAVAQSTAASNTQPENTPPADEPQGGLQDIVVTAQRRSENLQRAAIAVSAVSGESLRNAGVSRPADLTAVVPALQVAGNGGPYNLFYLRGVGNFSGNALSDSAISFNVDGVFVGRPTSTNGFFYDLERVEVVKGPQGTLYGRNATGGAINVITHKPELNKFGVDASAEYGNYDALRLDAAVNVPLGDQAALRVAGMRVRHDGYMNDGTDDQNEWGVRASLRVEPASNFSVNIVADYFDQGGNGVGTTPILAPLGVRDPSSLRLKDRVGLFSPEGQAFYTSQLAGTLGRNFSPIASAFRPFLNNSAWGISSTVEWATDLGTLTVIPGYRESSLDFRHFGGGFLSQQREKGQQTTLETRFATDEDNPLRAIFGTFYYKDNTVSPIAVFNLQWNSTYQRIVAETESKAIFGRLTYAVTPEIRFTVGARQTWEDKSLTASNVGITRVCLAAMCPSASPIPYGNTPPDVSTFPSVLVPPFGPSPYGGFPNVITDPNLAQFATITLNNNNEKFKKFTWRVGADWDITPRNLLYASYETGFKAGGFFLAADNPATPNVEGVFKPEAISAITIGSKNRFLDNRVQVNLELFHWRYKDQQISHLGTDYLGTIGFPTENVGKATFKGFEIETRFAATELTTLTADLQYLDAKYKDFVYTTPNLNGGFYNGTGCLNAAPPGAAYTVNCSGKRPPNAPKWTLNLGAEQRVPVSFGEFIINARGHYQSATLTGLEFTPFEIQKAYWIADAQVSYYTPDRKYFIGAFMNNIFDSTIKQAMFPTTLTNFYATSLRPPRTYGVRAGVKF